jgi:hypothetical protein
VVGATSSFYLFFRTLKSSEENPFDEDRIVDDSSWGL